MAWSQWDWLSLLLLVVLLVVAAMSWLNNTNPSHHNQQQPTRRTHQPLPNAASASLARTAPTSLSHPAAPSASQSPSLSLSLPAQPPTASFASTADETAFIAALLQRAHTSLAHSQPMHALSLVLAAVRQQRGEEGVFDVLNETRESFGLAAHVNPVRQQRLEVAARLDVGDEDMGLGALSLRSAGPVLLQRPKHRLRLASGRGADEDTEMTDDSEAEGEERDEDEEDGGYGEGDGSLLDEAGHGDVVDEAVRAGTHVTCRACGGVISCERMQAHAELWCEANENAQSHGDG